MDLLLGGNVRYHGYMFVRLRSSWLNVDRSRRHEVSLQAVDLGLLLGVERDADRRARHHRHAPPRVRRRAGGRARRTGGQHAEQVLRQRQDVAWLPLECVADHAGNVFGPDAREHDLLHLAGVANDLQAIRILDEAALLQSTPGAAEADLGVTLSELANSHFYAGHFDLSDAINRRVLAMDRRIYGERHPQVANDLINLGF